MTLTTDDTTNPTNGAPAADGAGNTAEFRRAEERTAHNYHPLTVVVAHAEGA